MVAVLAGCGGAQSTLDTTRPGGPTVAPEDIETTPLRAGVVRAGDYVSASMPRCAEDASDDDCDGLDDDCDGVIDGGCGLTGGKLQVVAAWSSGADIDLYVEEPLGDTMSFQRGRTMSGGRVEHAGRGACGASGADDKQLEGFAWAGPGILRGEYRVVLHYWGECQTMAGPTIVQVSIAVEGHVVSTMTYELSPSELKQVARFVID